MSQYSSRIWLKSIFWGIITNSPSFIYLLYPDQKMVKTHPISAITKLDA